MYVTFVIGVYLTLGVDDGALLVDAGTDGGYSVVTTVVLVVVVSRCVTVVVCVAVPPFKMLLQKISASSVCPRNASSPHLPTENMLA